MALDSIYNIATPDQPKDIATYIKIAISLGAPVIAWFFTNIYLERFKEDEFD